MKKTIFTGSGVAIVTPMYEDGKVNYDELARLIEFQIEQGTDAIISCGTTGESATLDHDEHCKVLDFTIQHVNHRVPVIAGTGSNDTMYAVQLAQSAEESGADGLLMVTPYYNKTSQSGLVRHFTYVADRVNTPIILYNVPSRTGCNIQPETYLELSKHPNIVATKEANGNVASTIQTMSLCGDELAVYSGEDDLTLPLMAMGGKGVISVFANVMPKTMHELCAAVLKGDLEAARKIQYAHTELMKTLFMDVNPIPVKEALNMMGYACGPCRMPLAPLSDAAHEKLATIMKKYGLVK